MNETENIVYEHLKKKFDTLIEISKSVPTFSVKTEKETLLFEPRLLYGGRVVIVYEHQLQGIKDSTLVLVSKKKVVDELQFKDWTDSAYIFKFVKRDGVIKIDSCLLSRLETALDGSGLDSRTFVEKEIKRFING